MTLDCDDLEIHEIATLFPAMSAVDAEHLRASIETEGQLEEILVFEGKILDGRHRYAACQELGIDPRVREFRGDLALAFAHSVALNLGRRHLTTVQRAAAGAGIKEFQRRLLANDEPLESEPPRIDVSIQPQAEPPAETEAETQPEPKPKAKPKRKPSERTINAKAREIASKQVGVSGRAIDTAAKIKVEAPDVFERMLAGTAGSMPDAKRVTALPADVREQVHALVDEGKKLKQALREVAPPPAPAPGPVFLGKVLLSPEQAEAFHTLLEERGLKRADAAREALVDWITKHNAAAIREPELVAQA